MPIIINNSMNFKEWLLSEESIEQNFDKWIEDIKNHAGPKESEIISMKNWLDDKKIQFIKNTLKKKNQENKQYLKYLIGFANTPQASFQEDYERAIDTIQWFITTNKMTKKQIEEQGWFNTGKQANDLIKQKNQIVNTVSATQAKKERKAGKSDDLPIVAQSGNIKIYLSEKVLQKNEIEELTNSNKLTKHPAIVARHAFLCRYGKNTEWCTASPDGDYHADYGDRDIYIVHINDKPEYQFMGCTKSDSVYGCQFHDSGNLEAKKIPIELEKLIIDELPDIAKYYKIFFRTIYGDKIDTIETVEDILKIFDVKKIEELTPDDIDMSLEAATEKDKIAELIINNKPELSNGNVYSLLKGATGKDKIAELIINKKPELSDNNVFNLIVQAINKYEIAKLIIKKKPEFSSDNVESLLLAAEKTPLQADVMAIAYLIIEKKPELSNEDIKNLLFRATDKEKIAEAIINKIPNLSDDNVSTLLDIVNKKYEIAKLIIEKKPELSDKDVYSFLYQIDTVTDIDKFVKLLGSYNISKLSYDNLDNLFTAQTPKILRKLSKKANRSANHTYLGNYDILRIQENQIVMKLVPIINKYHTKKTSEIQHLIRTKTLLYSNEYNDDYYDDDYE